MPASYARALLASNQAKLVGWYSELDEIQFGESFASSKMIATRRSTIDKFLRAYRRGVTDYTEALLRKDRKFQAYRRHRPPDRLAQAQGRVDKTVSARGVVDPSFVR
jgi:hypothetical protein